MIVTCKKRKWHKKLELRWRINFGIILFTADTNLRTEYLSNTYLPLLLWHIIHPFAVDTKRFYKRWNIMLSGGPVHSLAQFSKKLITWWKKDLVVVGRIRTAGKWNVILHNSRLLSGTASSNLVNRKWPPTTENFRIIARQWLKSVWLPQGYRNFSQGKKIVKGAATGWFLQGFSWGLMY